MSEPAASVNFRFLNSLRIPPKLRLTLVRRGHPERFQLPGIAFTELLDRVGIRQALRLQPENHFGKPEGRKLGRDHCGFMGG
jgi:hypothetical protein